MKFQERILLLSYGPTPLRMSERVLLTKSGNYREDTLRSAGLRYRPVKGSVHPLTRLSCSLGLLGRVVEVEGAGVGVGVGVGWNTVGRRMERGTEPSARNRRGGKLDTARRLRYREATCSPSTLVYEYTNLFLFVFISPLIRPTATSGN